MTYKTIKVGDRVKCNNFDEAWNLAYILENDGFKCHVNTRKDGAPEVHIWAQLLVKF